MLLAGMATRTFCATASPLPKNPIQRKTASVTPYCKTNPSVARLVSVFMLHSFESAACHSSGVLTRTNTPSLRSLLRNHIRNFDPVLFIPFSSDKRTAGHPQGFGRCEVDGAGSHDFRAKHLLPFVAGNFAYGLSRYNPSRVKGINPYVMRAILQRHDLRYSLNAELLGCALVQ